MSILLVGCGRMGTALLRGWRAAGIEGPFHVIEPQDIPAGLADIHFRAAGDFAKADITPSVAVLAVKPQAMDDICRLLLTIVGRNTLVLSIAAGRTLSSFEKHFGTDQPVVRSMPNTPAAIGQGITVAVANDRVTPSQKNLATALLRAGGMVAWIADEDKMDAVTALSGSGPAYVFYLIEVLAQAGVACGLPPDFAMTLARRTVTGAAALAEADPDMTAAALRESVTSPGGTTAAALEVLRDSGDMQDIFTRALKAATARGRALRS